MYESTTIQCGIGDHLAAWFVAGKTEPPYGINSKNKIVSVRVHKAEA
jgi:hypothetical protein